MRCASYDANGKDPGSPSVVYLSCITLNFADTDVIGLKRETLRLWTRHDPEGP